MLQDIKEGTLLWEPSTAFQHQTNIAHYMDWLQENNGRKFSNYQTLWEWSTKEVEAFWASMWEYFGIQSPTAYKQVLAREEMPGAKWFEGSTLNYTAHIFKNMTKNEPAIIAKSELRQLEEISWQELYNQVAAFAQGLRNAGIQKGDRVVAFMPNISESVVAFLATASIGAIWSSCSPDFGSAMVIDRFKQIEPSIFITVDGYQYNGKSHYCMNTAQHIQQAIPTLKQTIVLPYLDNKTDIINIKSALYWEDFVSPHKGVPLIYEQVPFEHPLWVLFSSGTTGLPKPIVQGQGGILLEHLKVNTFHIDLKQGDRFFWFSTTGWMMWNLLVGGLLTGSTILLYDGSPGYPDLEELWRFAEETKMTVFGTSASFLLSCKNSGLSPKTEYDLSHLKSIGSTGSPLPPEGFAWVYNHVKEDIWLASTSGGTDLCTAFVTGTPTLPVYAGEIQSRALGAAIEAFDEAGHGLIDEMGELVITKPMPSMPVYFWNDTNGERYFNSYFDVYPGIWRHGDWIKITTHGSCQIYGRSDSTINRGGIRIGTSEIYSAVERNEIVEDSLVIDISNEKANAFMPLFVVLKNGNVLNETLAKEIKQQVRTHCSPRHVPSDIYQIEEVPRTLNGKKLEVPIKKLLMGKSVEKTVSKDALRNPETLKYFIQFTEQINNKLP